MQHWNPLYQVLDMLGASHKDDYIRAPHRMRKMGMTHIGGEVSEYVGEAFKPQIAGKDGEGRLLIQQTGQVCQTQYQLL